MKFWNSLVAQEVAAVISALVLAIGAVIEYWSKIKVLGLLALKWILRRSTAFDRCTFRRLLIHSVGPILVVLGIAGEFVFEGRTFVLGYRQEQQSESAVVSLREKASANERDAEQLRKDAAKLTKDAEDERLARVKIEASVAWRRLSEQQKNDLGKKLEKYAGLALVRYNGGDSEAAAFAVSIEDALSRAHWRKYSATSPYMSSSQLPTADENVLAKAGFFTGVAIEGGDSSTLAAVRTLIKLLVDAGFDAGRGWVPPMYPKDSSVRASAQERQAIEVYVKHRPEGPQGEYKLQAEREPKAKKKQAQSSQVTK